MKQIDKLEKQNPNLAINVFGWEKERVIVHRPSEKDRSPDAYRGQRKIALYIREAFRRADAWSKQ